MCSLQGFWGLIYPRKGQEIWSALLNVTRIWKNLTLTLPKEVPLYLILILLIRLSLVAKLSSKFTLYFLFLKYSLMRNRNLAYLGFAIIFPNLLSSFSQLPTWHRDLETGGARLLWLLHKPWYSHTLNDLPDGKKKEVGRIPHPNLCLCLYLLAYSDILTQVSVFQERQISRYLLWPQTFLFLAD